MLSIPLKADLIARFASRPRLTYLWNQHPIPRDNIHGDLVAIPIRRTRPDSKNPSLVDILQAAFGEDDARGGLGLRL
jgi:hypothetical protein